MPYTDLVKKARNPRGRRSRVGQKRTNPPASTPSDFRQMFGTLLRERREDLGLTLDQVAQLAAARIAGSAARSARAHQPDRERARDPQHPRSASLERGAAPPARRLFPSADAPWFIVRDGTVRERLKEVIEGKREIQRTGTAHQKLIARGVYRYVPLVQSPDYVDERDQYGTMTPHVSVTRFLVSRADLDWMNEPDALSSHEGEEIIYVLSGEVEFWCKTADSTEPVTRTLHPGDCLHFSSRVSHGFRAIGAKDAEALFVYAMPPDASMPPAVKDRMPARKRRCRWHRRRLRLRDPRQHRLERGRHTTQLPRSNHEIPQRLEFLPARGVEEVLGLMLTVPCDIEARAMDDHR